MEIKYFDYWGSVYVQIIWFSVDWLSGIFIDYFIQNVYFDIICNVKYYVYIENQFFIIVIGDQQNFIYNIIGCVIVDVVVSVVKEGCKFCVMIFILVVFGFVGDL